MENKIIKSLVREELNMLFEKAKKKSNEDKNDSEPVSATKSSYPDVVNALDKDKHPNAPSLVGIAQTALGYDPDDSTDRSDFRQKVYQIANKEGGRKRLLPKELAKVRAGLGIR